MNEVNERSDCRVCSGQIEPVLDLGKQFISNFLRPDQSHHFPEVPLELVRCVDCTLVQLRHTAPRDWIYRQTYWYTSGTNESMVEALQDVVSCATMLCPLQSGDSVVDIGANDGTLLAAYQGTMLHRPTRIAFEPASNLIDELSRNADVVFHDYFPPVREDFLIPRTKIITSIAMFYDLEDPNVFVDAIRSLLDRNGLWIIQQAYLPDMLKQNAFDNICHEHLEYYSLRSLNILLSRHGFKIVDVERNEVNGGSFRVYVKHGAADSLDGYPGARIRIQKIHEEESALLTNDVWEHFGKRLSLNGERVWEIISSCDGPVDVYGASTKGNTLLQTWGLGGSEIRWAIERSPKKWGRETVGTRIPIVDETRGRREPAKLWLILPWHFKENFIRRERAFLEAGGKMLFPLPEPHIITCEGERGI